jgi:hypothetical protein
MTASRRPPSRPALAAGLPLLALAGFTLDCGSARPLGPDRTAATRAGAPDAPTPASASASVASAAETPSPGAPEAPPPPRLGTAGSTKRTIACGQERCPAGEETCIARDRSGGGGEWVCASSGNEGDSEEVYACDDASDCAAGKACCRSFASGASYYSCTARKGPGSDCRYEICVEGDGAACPPGQTCQQGACGPKTSARATCGDAKRCPADKPICRWGADGPSCLRPSEAEAMSHEQGFANDEFSLYSCTRPADCGRGSQCCTGMTEGPKVTLCGGNCDLANSIVVCEKRAECLQVCDEFEAGPRAACRKNVRCAEIGRGLKGCIDLQ